MRALGGVSRPWPWKQGAANQPSVQFPAFQMLCKKADRTPDGIVRGFGVAFHLPAAGAGIVETMGSALVDADLDVASLRVAPFDEALATLGRYFLVVGAMEHLHR